MSTIYVTGHRNPDTDSIASAIGYAELRQRLDPGEEYVAVRLGDLNAQTDWALERAGLEAPVFLEHVMLRARDVMRPTFAAADHNASLRDVGLAMAKGDLDLIPIVDDDGRDRRPGHRPRPGPPLREGVRGAVELRRPAGVGGPDRGGARGRAGGAPRAHASTAASGPSPWTSTAWAPRWAPTTSC